MRTVRGVLAAAVAALSMAGCALGSGPGSVTTEQRPVEGVRAVRLETSGDLSLASGSAGKLTVTAGRDVLSRLTSTVKDGTLVLGSKPDTSSSGDIRYSLTLPRLEGLAVTGSGGTRGAVVADGAFTVEASGSGGIDLTGLTVSDLVVRMSGSGDVRLSGQAATQRVSIGGSGGYDGRDLTSRQADVVINGSGDARVNTSQRLSADITGNGDVTYTGTPANVQSHISGSGSIHPG